MSEFTVRTVDYEEKSLAEKETELLKAHEEQPEETPTIDLSNVETPIETPPANEPVELDESTVVSYLGKRWNREINSLDDLAEQRSVNEDLPEDVSAFLKYKKETGRGIEDFINLNKDYNTMDQDALLLEYNREQNKGLDLDGAVVRELCADGEIIVEIDADSGFIGRQALKIISAVYDGGH